MKKNIPVLLVITLMAVILSCAKGYEARKTVGNLSITLTADRYPLVKGDNSLGLKMRTAWPSRRHTLVKGDNSLGLKIADPGDKAVTDAKVEARYYMPAMPGMAPMEFTTQAAPKGSAYAFSANIPMEGGWKVDVAVTQPGSAPQTVTFNVDAR